MFIKNACKNKAMLIISDINVNNPLFISDRMVRFGQGTRKVIAAIALAFLIVGGALFGFILLGVGIPDSGKLQVVAAIEAALSEAAEAIVSVRGKDRFVVMDIAHYHYLRECELDAALAESRADVAAGRFVEESAAEHLARLDKMA